MRRNQQLWKSFYPEVVLLIIYFATRLFHLNLLPMFVDEATHIRWAIEIVREGDFSSAIEASRLFPIWSISLVVPSAANDLLWASRLVSVGFGVWGLIGCYLLGKQLFNRQVGILASVLYLVVPYTFFYDRMALVDSLLAIWAIYVVLFSLLLGAKPSLKYGISLGVVLALASLTKLNGFTFGILPLVVLAARFTYLRRKFPWKPLLLAYGVGLLGFVPLALSSSTEWWQIEHRTWLGQESDTPLWSTWLFNGSDTALYLAQNLSWLVFIVACLGIILTMVRRQRDELLLCGAVGIILAIFIFLSRSDKTYPRYLLPAVPFLLVIVAQTIIWAAHKFADQAKSQFGVISSGVTFIIILPALWFDYWFMTNPAQAPLLEIDRFQYIESNYAGYGLVETADYLRDQLSHVERIIVVCPERPSTLSAVLQVYLYDEQQRIIYLTMDFSKEDLDILAQRLQEQSVPVFIVIPDPPPDVTKSKVAFDAWPYIQRVAHFERPGGLTGVNIYKKIP